MHARRTLAPALAVFLAAVGVGCGFGPGDPDEGVIRLTITRDYGAERLLEATRSDPPESETVLSVLDREAEIFPVTGRALAVFERTAPEGVRVRVGGGGTHYAQYSFEPSLRIINGFVQSLVGLYDYGRLADDDRARALYETGERRARREVPTYDTGAWSLYSRGSVQRESDLGYHTLLRDFLSSLCDRTQAETYCGAVERFTGYLAEPPELQVRTRRLRGGGYRRVAVSLSKVSYVTLRIQRAGRLVHARYVGALSGGAHTLGWAVPRQAGAYTVELVARDLAGNAATVAAEVDVLRPRRAD